VLKIEKLGYNYNDLDSDQAKSLLDILLKEKGILKVFFIYFLETGYKRKRVPKVYQKIL